MVKQQTRLKVQVRRLMHQAMPNYADFWEDDKLFLALSAVVNGKSDRALVFSHPVFQYLTRRYDLNAKSVYCPDGAAVPLAGENLGRFLRSMRTVSAPLPEIPVLFCFF